MSREEMIALFTVERLNDSPAVFDREKLLVDERAVHLSLPSGGAAAAPRAVPRRAWASRAPTASA